MRPGGGGDKALRYTIELDMSDRGGRPEKEPRFGGSDWFIGKSHDTFAPMGPWIVPKEFYGDPMAKLKQTLLVGSDQRQHGLRDISVTRIR